MPKSIYFLIFFCFLAVMVSCRDSGPQGPAKSSDREHGLVSNTEDLLQSWTHSREEESRKTVGRIYRPTDSRRFPPSRFRMRYVFHGDGTCRWMHLDPADRHTMRTGRWSLDPKEKDVVIILDKKGRRVEAFRILELSKDLLRIAPIR